MGKRRASRILDSSAKTEASFDLREVKNEKLNVSSESEHDDYEDRDQTELYDTTVKNGDSAYEPDRMRILVESFTEFLNDRQYSAVTIHNMEKLVTEWGEIRPEDSIDVGLFCADYRKYLKSALKIGHLHLNDATMLLTTYLSSEKSLKEFKSFPARPPTKLKLYLEKNNLKLTLGGMGVAYRHMRENDSAEEMEEINEKVRAATLQYLPALQHFLDSHPNLTEIQRRAVEVKIKQIQKLTTPKQPKGATPKRPRKRGRSSKKEPETAFRLFCRTKTDKYRDLSEEDRERKLQKKFDKLSTGEREILEKLAFTA
ncbi:unnamed protein product [Caenorhabditis sp. 36 PRJEB53466]|nr:unnamed protein product [Caenorhabditis sp. 36 PRJEB53466]